MTNKRGGKLRERGPQSIVDWFPDKKAVAQHLDYLTASITAWTEYMQKELMDLQIKLQWQSERIAELEEELYKK